MSGECETFGPNSFSVAIQNSKCNQKQNVYIYKVKKKKQKKINECTEKANKLSAVRICDALAVNKTNDIILYV